jgi:hypothetical protein
MAPEERRLYYKLIVAYMVTDDQCLLCSQQVITAVKMSVVVFSVATAYLLLGGCNTFREELVVSDVRVCRMTALTAGHDCTLS